MYRLSVFTILLLASPVQADLCSSQWWQIESREQEELWQQVKDIIESEEFDVDVTCNEQGDSPLHIALKIPAPMSIESYYAIATFVETVPFLTDKPFLYFRNQSGQTPYTLARRRFENMLERINENINLSPMTHIVEREAPEYRLYSSILMGFPGGNLTLIDHALRMDPDFLELMIDEMNKGLTF